METNKSLILTTIKEFLNTQKEKSFQFNEDTKINLQLFGEDTETLLLDIYLTQSPRRADDMIMLISRPTFESGQNDDVDCLSHLSADECERILGEIRRQFYRNEYDIIYKTLREKDADFDEIWHDDDGFAISVNWGDWKHSHAYLKHLMRELGYTQIEEELTEEDGSDTYSSIHYFKRTNNVSL